MRARRWGACPSVSSLTHEARRLGSTAARLKLKGIDGGPHKRWSMWFNSKQREEPYLGLTCWCKPVETSDPLRSASTGAAWLSSARVVRCWVKSRNERNSRSQLPAVRPGTLGGLPALSRRKGGRRQVIMALTSRATHVLQCLVQRVANSQEGANRQKP